MSAPLIEGIRVIVEAPFSDGTFGVWDDSPTAVESDMVWLPNGTSGTRRTGLPNGSGHAGYTLVLLDEYSDRPIRINGSALRWDKPDLSDPEEVEAWLEV